MKFNRRGLDLKTRRNPHPPVNIYVLPPAGHGMNTPSSADHALHMQLLDEIESLHERIAHLEGFLENLKKAGKAAMDTSKQAVHSAAVHTKKLINKAAHMVAGTDGLVQIKEKLNAYASKPKNNFRISDIIISYNPDTTGTLKADVTSVDVSSSNWHSRKITVRMQLKGFTVQFDSAHPAPALTVNDVVSYVTTH